MAVDPDRRSPRCGLIDRAVQIRDHVDISAPIELVWDVFTDVERWPGWTESVTSVSLQGDDGLTLGSVVDIKQPRLPRLSWTVTEIDPGRAWTWVARSPGTTTSATHTLTTVAGGTTQVEQVIDQRGAVGAVVGRLARSQTHRYLAMEAAGLRAVCEARAASGDRGS